MEKYGTNCKCGRNLQSVRSIKGRDNDILITPKGEYLIAQTFTTYFKYISSIEQYQIHQKDLDHFVFKLTITQEFSPKIIEEIKEHWQNYMGGKVKIEVEIVDSLDLLSSGKRRFLIRNKDIDLRI